MPFVDLTIEFDDSSHLCSAVKLSYEVLIIKLVSHVSIIGA